MARAHLIVPALAFALMGSACGIVGGGEGFRIKKASCDEDFLDWTGGLTHHLLQGRGDGSFDYEPPGKVERRVAGDYDLTTGDFDWEVEYHADHWRTSTEVEGYGYAATNGDLDIEATITTSDILGNTWTQVVREERVGCEVERLTLTASGALIEHQGRFRDGEYRYTTVTPSTQGPDFVVEGTMRPDRSYTAELDWSGGGIDYSYTEEGDGDGYSLRDWLQVSDGNTFDGITEQFLDGSEHTSYTISGAQSGSWDYQVDYAGNGSGNYASGTFTCTLEFTNWNCVATCNDGNQYQC